MRIEGSSYNGDYTPIMNDALNESLVYYKLKPIYLKHNIAHYANGNCEVKFWNTDHNRFNWSFINPKSKFEYKYDSNYYISAITKIKYEYNLTFYLRFIENIDRPLFFSYKEILNRAVDFNSLVYTTFKVFNYELLTYMKRPMKGDFSWHAEYKQKLLRLQKIDLFSNSARLFQKEMWQLALDYLFERINIDEVELYMNDNLPDGGKKFEPDPNSIPDE